MNKADDIYGKAHLPEKCICAAIWVNDGEKREHLPRNLKTGIVFAGWRHHNCFTPMVLLPEWKKFKHTQGFLTSKGNFVDRREGGKVAFNAGQIDEENECLFSEDLY